MSASGVQIVAGLVCSLSPNFQDGGVHPGK
jgi:hypothetical protein